MRKHVYIIAEAGVNHNGDLDTAKEMVLAAKKAGADAIKFQTFIAENLVTQDVGMAQYQIHNTGKSESQYEMLKKLELPFEAFRRLKGLCEETRIEFMSTPFDQDSIAALERLKVDRFKIPSGEITNYPYLVRMAKTGCPIIMSTGMCTLSEIKEALEVLKDNGASDISLLHCTTEYPAPFQEVNLKAMRKLRETFHVKAGYSDHTQGIEIAIAAAAMGADIIEKHFTLDKNMEGPDHQASLNPSELACLVRSIRNVEMALGDGEKKPSLSERKNMEIVRKSIVAKRDIKQGELFSEENLTTKRPGTGLTPMKWNFVIGQTARKDFFKDELIEL